MVTCGHGNPPGCWFCERDRRGRAYRGSLQPKPSPVRQCIHLGPIVEYCPRGDPLLNVHWCQCERHDVDRCTIGHNRTADVPSCLDCRYRQIDPVAAPAVRLPYPTPVVRFDESNLAPGRPGKRFNSSLIRYRGELLLAYRDGWRGSQIHVVRLDDELRPVGDPVALHLHHADANYGREDPRLFVHRDRLHVAFIGVVGGRRIRHTNQLYARLRDDLTVEAVHHPQYAGRNSWEKNWQFFDHGGQLYAVYSVAPHRVLRIDGDRAELAYETGTPAPWSGGELRGGASPVRIDDEFHCFFHSRTDDGGHLIYNTGHYTFEARPPFRVTGIVPDPILYADRSTCPPDQYASVVFPCGAVRDRDRWLVSHGVHDRWTEIHAFEASDIERRTHRIAPPPWWSYHPWPAIDRDVFADVVRSNEYKLPAAFGPDDAVIDCGGNVGSFAYAAWSRGSRRIHCVEPSVDSLAHLRSNAAHMPGVEVHAGAIGRGVLYWHPSADTVNTGGGYCSETPSEFPVAAMSLDDAIALAGGRVAFLKLDIEGAEWDAVANCTTLHLVEQIGLEWHPPGDPETMARTFRAAGLTVESVPTVDGRGLMFATRQPVKTSSPTTTHKHDHRLLHPAGGV